MQSIMNKVKALDAKISLVIKTIIDFTNFIKTALYQDMLLKKKRQSLKTF